MGEDQFQDEAPVIEDHPEECCDGSVEYFQLAEDLQQHRADDLAERKRFFMSQCVKWHPDKNIGNERLANQMFQLLQEKKAWFLAVA